MPARSSAALTAHAPRSVPEKSRRPPSSLPIGVRAPPTITDPGTAGLLHMVWVLFLHGTAGPKAWVTVTIVFLGIDHVGIAVPDLDEAIAWYGETFGLASVHEEVNEDQGVREAMLAVGDGTTQIQLL